MLVHEFPKASEPFLVDKFTGLIAHGFDVHLVAEQELRGDYKMYPQLAENSGLRRRIHAWPQRSRPFALLAMALREVAWALLLHPVRTATSIGKAFRHPLREVPGRFLFTLPLLRIAPDLIHFEFGSLAANRVDLVSWIAPRSSASFRGWDLNFFALDEPERLRRVFERVDRIHFVGEDLRRRARRRGLLGDTLSDVISPAVDCSHFDASAHEPSRSGDVLQLVSVGRLHWKKGYEFALQAIRRLLDAGIALEYRIIGSGPFEGAVRTAIADLELSEFVTLLGKRSREEVLAELKRADLFLHAAVSEGFCNAVLEAQAMGVPVVCSDADGLPENVAHGSTGYVVPRRDSDSMADALLKLTRDPALRERFGQAGTRRVRDHFDPAAQIRAFVDFYENAESDS